MEAKLEKHLFQSLVPVALVLNGTVIPNHGLVLLEDIGDSDAALLCTTDLVACCYYYPDRFGDWFFPNGTVVPNSVINDQSLQWDFYRNRGPSVVRMNRRRGGVNGIYHCEIPDQNGVSQSLYVGVYTRNTGKSSLTYSYGHCANRPHSYTRCRHPWSD